MSEKLDDISRVLASGVSRRKAVWQLLTGAGGLALFGTKKASANDAKCASFCFQGASVAFTDCMEDSSDPAGNYPKDFFGALIYCLGFQGEFYNSCTQFSLGCPSGKCGMVVIDQSPGEIDFHGDGCVTPNI